MDSHHEKSTTIMKACREKTEAMREACLKSNEPTSLEIESVAVHEEVPKEEAAGKTVTSLTKR
jgi:hypothetical protein